METQPSKNKGIDEIIIFTIGDDQIRITKKGLLNIQFDIVRNGKKLKKTLEHESEIDRNVTFDFFGIRRAKQLLRYIDRGKNN